MPNPESPTPDPAEGLAAVIAEMRKAPVPPTIATDDEFRDVYCQGYRHALADVETALAARVARSAPPVFGDLPVESDARVNPHMTHCLIDDCALTDISADTSADRFLACPQCGRIYVVPR